MDQNYREQYLKETDITKKVKICLSWWSSLTPAWRLGFIRSTVLGSMNNYFFYNYHNKEERWNIENHQVLIMKMTSFSPSRFISLMDSVFQDPLVMRLNGYILKNPADPNGWVSWDGDDYTVWRAQSLRSLKGWTNLKSLDIRYSDIESLEPIWDLKLTVLRSIYNLIGDGELKRYHITHPGCNIRNNTKEDIRYPEWQGGDPSIVYTDRKEDWNDIAIDLLGLKPANAQPESFDSFKWNPKEIEADETINDLRAFLQAKHKPVKMLESTCPLCAKAFPSSAYDWINYNSGNTPMPGLEKLPLLAEWNNANDAVGACPTCGRFFHIKKRQLKSNKAFYAIYSATTIEDILGRFSEINKEAGCTNTDLKMLE